MPTEPTEQELLHDAGRSLDTEILNEAFQDEPAQDTPAEGEEIDQDQPPATSQQEQPRNERGQFAARDKDGNLQEQPRDKDGNVQEPPQEPEGDGESVPRWRLREIAEERRQAQAERDQLRVELIRLQTQQARPQPQQPGQEQPQQIDPLLDPQGWQRQIEAGFEQRLRTIELNSDLRIAHMQHGKDFEKAYEALVETAQRDRGQLIRQLTASSQGAGERIVRWYKNQELLRETNGDLTGFRNKVADDLLKDPEFLKKAEAALRTQAAGGGQQGQRPNNITRLPPSLSRQAGSSVSDPIDTDDSDASVFDYAMK